MSESQEPCSVCGGKDMNLLDGYYYCVECGTQDINVRETVVDTELADGTLGLFSTKKINTTIKDGIEMSVEWTKWHTFNFILSGLADELIDLGAPEAFKTKLLWVWTRYMKAFHIKEDVLSKSLLQEWCTDESETKKKHKKGHNYVKNPNIDKFGSTITFHLLISLIYVALNLERSDILLSHLQRFLIEGHLSSTNCTKYVPKDLEAHKLPKWSVFIKQCSMYQHNFDSVKSTLRFRTTAMSAFKKLNLGIPLTPDLRKIVNDCITELCLPNDFEVLVFSLLELAPVNNMILADCFGRDIIRVPDYEGIVMAYILVALKMCFGLDDHYEIQLSHEIDKINIDKNRARSYKLGSYSELTDRLFCFREWCNFLQYRKHILSKYYLPIAEKYGIEADDYLFMEHTKERPVNSKTLFDEITMDITDRLPLDNEYPVIPKSEFIPTFTPLTTYTQVVLQYLQDPDLKLLLSEDFTQYSLKYACSDLKLPTEEKDVFQGVTKDNFTVDKAFYDERCGSILDDTSMVFVKNCDNKNWLETKPPDKKHMMKVEYDSEGDSNLDYGYDSNEEITANYKYNDLTKTHENVIATEIDDEYTQSLSFFQKLLDETETKTKLELMREEDECNNIFHDDFADLEIDVKTKMLHIEMVDTSKDHLHVENEEQVDNNNDQFDNNFEQSADNYPYETDQLNHSNIENLYDPSTFDKEQTLRELVSAACKELRIPIPAEHKPKDTRKREAIRTIDETQDIDVKRRKTADETDNRTVTKPGEARKEVDRIIEAYYKRLEESVTNVLGTDHDVVRPNSDETLNYDDNPPEDNGLINEEANLANVDNIHELDRSELNADSTCFLEGTSQDNDDELDSFLIKGDPKYDGETHDIRQLYLKFKENFDIDDLIKPDEELERIIKKQLGFVEMCQDDDLQVSTADSSEKRVDDSLQSDSAPKITLKKMCLPVGTPNVPCPEFLINRDINVKSFDYWMRTYPARYAFKTVGINTRFDGDLQDEFPKSFNFLINECATIVNTTPYMLYKHFQTVEERLRAVRKLPT